MQSYSALTKCTIVLIITMFSNLVLSQTTSEIKQIKKSRIEKETDSLILIRDQKNKELEKNISSKEYRIKTIKDSCKYNDLLNSKKYSDSIYNELSLRLKKFQEICKRERRLDSLNSNQKITLYSTMELSMKDYQKRGYPVFKSDETLHPKSYPNLKPVENLESKMKNVPSYLILRGGSATNGVYSKYNVDFNLPYSPENFKLFVKHNAILIDDSTMSKFESQLKNQHISRIGSYDFISGLIKKNKVFINPESQLNDEIVEELGTKLGKGELIIAMTKSDYENLLSENKNKMTSECRSIVWITEKSDFDYEHYDKWGENEVYLITIYNGQLHHSRLEFRENNGVANYSLEYPLFFECENKNFSFNVGVKKMLKYKKFEKAIEKYNLTEIDESEKNKLLFTLGNDVRFFNRFISYSDSLKDCQNNFKTIQLNKQTNDKQFDYLEKLVRSEESKYNVKSDNISKEITQISSLVNQKEERIKIMIEEEDRRIVLISEADKLTEQKNYEQAISKYEYAFNIRNSDDIQVKLKKTKDLYAPILAKKQEEERLVRIEKERALIEETKRKEREMPITVLHYLINNRAISASAEIQDFKMTTISSCFIVSIIRISDINSYGTKYYRDYYVDISNGYPCYEEYSSTRLSQWDLEMKSNFLKKNYDYFLKTADTEKEREQQIKTVDKYYEMYKNRASVVGCGCSF